MLLILLDGQIAEYIIFDEDIFTRNGMKEASFHKLPMLPALSVSAKSGFMKTWARRRVMKTWARPEEGYEIVTSSGGAS